MKSEIYYIKLEIIQSVSAAALPSYYIKVPLRMDLFIIYTSYDDILGIRALKDKAYERHAHVFYILSNGIRFVMK